MSESRVGYAEWADVVSNDNFGHPAQYGTAEVVSAMQYPSPLCRPAAAAVSRGGDVSGTGATDDVR